MKELKLTPAAKNRLKLTKAGYVGIGLLLVGFPVFLASNVVGLVEFSLPTRGAPGVVTEVTEWSPFHVKHSFRYEVIGQVVHDSSWSDGHRYPVGSDVTVEYQTEYVDHSRIRGQRKYSVTLAQALVLPILGLLFMLLGAVMGRRRIRLVERGTLVNAELGEGELRFEIEEENQEAGYRDLGVERRLVRIPVTSSLNNPDGKTETYVAYDPAHPEQGLALGAHSLVVDEVGTIDSWRPPSRFHWIPFVPYFGFLMLLSAYYFSYYSDRQVEQPNDVRFEFGTGNPCELR